MIVPGHNTALAPQSASLPVTSQLSLRAAAAAVAMPPAESIEWVGHAESSSYPACLPACLPARLPVSLPARQPACKSRNLQTCQIY